LKENWRKNEIAKKQGSSGRCQRHQGKQKKEADTGLIHFVNKTDLRGLKMGFGWELYLQKKMVRILRT
jgi:hypothetical protein